MMAYVDPDLCTACGACVDICHEVFDQPDDSDVAVVLVDEVPPDQEARCREAAESCPVEAIIIEE